jgi:hypothetical protein
VESEDARTFFYRGRNLRYAVERALYFEFVENQTAFSQFVRHSKSLPQKAPGEKLVETLGSRILNGRSSRSNGPKWPFLIALLRRLRAAGRSIQWSRDLQENKAGEPVDVIFFLSHQKFTRYLSGVISRFGRAAAVCNSAGVIQTVSVDGIREIAPGTPDLIPRGAGRGLRHFSFLLQAFDSVLNTLERKNPSCVVVAEGNAPNDEIANQAAGALEIPTVCVQQGWSPIVHTGFRNMTYTGMLVWGSGFSDLLKPFNPRMTFIEVGDPGLPNVPLQSNWEKRGVAFFLSAPGSLITQGAWNDFLALIESIAATFPNAKVIVREHPVYRLVEDDVNRYAKYANIVFAPPESHSLADVIGMASISVSMYSSTVMESIAMGVVPVLANFTSIPNFFPDVAAEGAALETHTPGDAFDAISRCLSDRVLYESFGPRMSEVSRKYFSAVSDVATANIEREIRHQVDLTKDKRVA